MKFLSLLFLLLLAPKADAQVNYDLKFKIEHYPFDTLVIGYKIGSQQLIQDSLIKKNGIFELKGQDTLHSGVYLAVLQPKNDFIEFLIDDNDRKFTVSLDAKDLNTISFQSSRSNQLFLDYLRYQTNIRKKGATIIKDLQIQDSLKNDAERIRLTQQFMTLRSQAATYQQDFIHKNKETLPAAIAKSLLEVEIPEFQGSKQAIAQQKYNYYKEHYFDHIDFSDPRLHYTNFLGDKILYYFDNLIAPHPDSIITRIDWLVQKMEPNPEIQKYYLLQFVDKYSKLRTTGYEAIFVYISKKYFATNQVKGIDPDQLARIVRMAELAEPVLIGKTAPNITLYQEDGTPKSLYDTPKDYTVLFFWGAKCTHCTKAAPDLVEFYKKFKDQVELFTICSSPGNQTDMCWPAIKDNGFDGMINLTDPKYTSHFLTVYNVQETPLIYVLNKDKKILAKSFPVKALPKVMQQIIDRDKK